MENSIIDFIQNTFKDAQTINLEKIGQYLKQDNLKIQLSEDNNWQTFLKTKLTQKGRKKTCHLSFAFYNLCLTFFIHGF